MIVRFVKGLAMLQEKIKQTLWQIPLMVLAALLIAMGVNHWRTDGIPLIGDWSEDARFSGNGGDGATVQVEEAARLFKQNAALFIDARPAGQFAEGHIQGALSLPWQEADRYFMEVADRLDEASVIITYCDGEACNLSHELAHFLNGMGFENVRVLVNGWTLWRQAGLPTQMGE